MLGVGTQTVHRLIQSGELPARRLRGDRGWWVIDEAAVHEMAGGITVAEPMPGTELAPILTVSEVARYLRVSELSVRRYVAAGMLKAAQRTGRRSPIRIPRSSVEDFVSGGVRAGA